MIYVKLIIVLRRRQGAPLYFEIIIFLPFSVHLSQYCILYYNTHFYYLFSDTHMTFSFHFNTGTTFYVSLFPVKFLIPFKLKVMVNE